MDYVWCFIDDPECEEDPVPVMSANVAPLADKLELIDTVLNMEVMAGWGSSMVNEG